MKQLINQFFEYALKEKLIKTNPVSEIETIEVERRDNQKERMDLTPDQREKIFSSLEEDRMVTPIIITFVFTGLRSGELIALKWENVNFEKNTIAVKKSIKRVIEFDDKGIPVNRTHELANTKTTQSVRLSCLILWLNICSNGKNARYRQR